MSTLQHHLKKLEGRRLDFDYKKKRQGKVTEDEIKQALEKFDDSKEIAELSMFNLLESDVSLESSAPLYTFIYIRRHLMTRSILLTLCFVKTSCKHLSMPDHVFCSIDCISTVARIKKCHTDLFSLFFLTTHSFLPKVNILSLYSLHIYISY